MTIQSVSAVVRVNETNGGIQTTMYRRGDPNALVTAAQGAHKTSFESALATLVADGASPTQSHVTSVNAAYTTFKADIAALGGVADDVTILFNAANVASVSALDKVIRQLLRIVQGSGILTP